jgi:hypothetical protein
MTDAALPLFGDEEHAGKAEVDCRRRLKTDPPCDG